MKDVRGFTLLEAMVAVSLIGISIVIGMQVNKNTFEGLLIANRITGEARLANIISADLNNRGALEKTFAAPENAAFLGHRTPPSPTGAFSSLAPLLVLNETGGEVVAGAGTYYSANFNALPSISSADYFVTVLWQGLRFNNAHVFVRVAPVKDGVVGTKSAFEQMLFFPPNRAKCLVQSQIFAGSGSFARWGGYTGTCPVGYAATHVSVRPGAGHISSRVALDPNNLRRGSCYHMTPNPGTCFLTCCQFD